MPGDLLFVIALLRPLYGSRPPARCLDTLCCHYAVFLLQACSAEVLSRCIEVHPWCTRYAKTSFTYMGRSTWQKRMRFPAWGCDLLLLRAPHEHVFNGIAMPSTPHWWFCHDERLSLPFGDQR